MAITRYGSVDLVAGALHRDVMTADREDLRAIHQAIPQGTRAVVQIYISTDDATSPGTRVHHAATVLFENPTGRGLKVTATIASYESGAYRNPEMLLEGIAASADHDPTAARRDSGSDIVSREIEVTRHPLMDAEGKRRVMTLDRSTQGPLLQIAHAVQNIFPDGVPLPAHQHFHYCTFSVMRSSGDLFYLHRGVRGTAEEVGKGSHWGSICHGRVLSPEEYTNQQAVARGERLPYQLERSGSRQSGGEENVRPLRVLTGTANVAQRPAIEGVAPHPRIEELT